MNKLRSTMRSGKRTTQDKTEAFKSKRKSKTHVIEEEISMPSSYHFFSDPAEITVFRSRLLGWYDQTKRDLPWRTLTMTEKDVNIRTYAVWVSEVMLQQTQVATVTDYYIRWMKRWPTVQELSTASLEDVNKMWAGLGYYSRGRRLHEGARKVVSELAGEFPRTTQELLKQLPGVGRYTAGAVGSIALGLVTGAVDGNVTRVLCRLRAIGADSTSSLVTDVLWYAPTSLTTGVCVCVELADLLVDPGRPGDFNQALMEMGAMVCTPRSPLCTRCPVQAHCHAYQKASLKPQADAGSLLSSTDSKLSCSVPDIESCSGGSSCKLCLTEGWASDLGVQNYPRKPVKKAPRMETTLTCVLQRWATEEDEAHYLLTQRPNTGLLAGMWEFPSMLLEKGVPEKKHIALLRTEVQRILGTSPDEGSFQYLGEVRHVFSHIHQTYVVYSATLGMSTEADGEHRGRWLLASALQEAAISTGVKKIMKLYYESTSKSKSTKNTKQKHKAESPPDKQTKRMRTPPERTPPERTPPERTPPERTPYRGPRQLTLSRFFSSSKPASS